MRDLKYDKDLGDQGDPLPDDIEDDIFFCVIQHADQSCLDHDRKTSSRRK